MYTGLEDAGGWGLDEGEAKKDVPVSIFITRTNAGACTTSYANEDENEKD